MSYEVVVVGAGIGGLTVAALLAARGVSVCVLEREPEAGGCARPFERFGYRFEPGAGLYAGWGPDGVHARVFAELPPAPPESRRVAPAAYAVRLPDDAKVAVGGESLAEFEDGLRRAFPECAGTAVNFYRELGFIAAALRRAASGAPNLTTLSKLQRLKLIAGAPRAASRILARQHDTTARHLAGASRRFRRFIDAQLHIYAGQTSDECAYLYAATALTEPLERGLYSLRGGAAALTATLIESIGQSSGTIRFNASALRLTYDATGHATGVTLLSGERVAAARAVVSNLTVWDTYGKLVGTDRTPADVRAWLKGLRGRGAYVIYLGLEEAAAGRLGGDQWLCLRDWQEGQTYNAEEAQFMLSLPPAWDAGRAPAGRRAATASFFTDAEQWFAYHEDESGHETQDQRKLEKCWEWLHAAAPELGGGAEVIETVTPRVYYEQTRRRLGLVGGVGQLPETLFGARALTHRTHVPNLYRVGDTTFPGNGVAAVTHSALIVANEIAPHAG
ncbi:MAG: phytoene desaturase family protein [Pyrinomonadaceae bacterium]